MPELDLQTMWPWLAAMFAAGYVLGRITSGGGGPTAEERRAAAVTTIGRLSAQTRAQADAFLRDGKLIEAIKAIREETGLGLRDSKDIADELRRQTGG